MAGQPPRTIHGYELIRLLGTGSFGEVWEARAPGDHKAAVKLIHLSRSQAGAVLELSALETMKRFDHYHLVKTFASYNEPDQVVIIMELAAGTLFDRLKYCVEDGKLGIPPDELLHYMRQTASALDYLHAEGVIHRDIKPANILLFNLKAPFVKLGDCGLVREWTVGDETMTTLGTPAYIAPEMWARKGGPQSDQYSLAITYVELRQGRRPLTASNPYELAVAHIETDPDLEDLTEPEKPIVRRALAKRAENRYPSCLDFVVDLERALEVRPYTLRGGELGLSFKKAVTAAARPAATPPKPPRTQRMDDDEPSGTHMPSKSGDTHKAVGSLVSGGGSSYDLSSKVPDPPRPSSGKPTLSIPVPIDEDEPRLEPVKPWSWLSKVVLGLVGLMLVVLIGVVVAKLGPWGGGGHSGTKVIPDPEPEDPPPPDKPPIGNGGGGNDPPAPQRVAIRGFRPVNPKDEGVPFKDGKRYPERIVCEKHPELFFRLMLPRDGQEWDPSPFYLLETKVTNAMYERFAKAAGDDVAGREWRRGGRGRDGVDLGHDQSDVPVFRVSRPQAMAFGTWVDAAVVLPSADQLDRAAEYRVADAAADAGPFAGNGASVAVGQRDKGPSTVTADAQNHTPGGVRGLAGNGREWTRDNFAVGGRALAVYRGRSYTAAGPVTYRMLNDQRTSDAVKWTWDPDRPDATMGFRVVVEVK